MIDRYMALTISGIGACWYCAKTVSYLLKGDTDSAIPEAIMMLGFFMILGLSI